MPRSWTSVSAKAEHCFCGPLCAWLPFSLFSGFHVHLNLAGTLLIVFHLLYQDCATSMLTNSELIVSSTYQPQVKHIFSSFMPSRETMASPTEAFSVKSTQRPKHPYMQCGWLLASPFFPVYWILRAQSLLRPSLLSPLLVRAFYDCFRIKIVLWLSAFSIGCVFLKQTFHPRRCRKLTCNLLYHRCLLRHSHRMPTHL